MSYKRIKTIHRFVSVTFSLLFLIVAVSGIALNHRSPGNQPLLQNRNTQPAYNLQNNGNQNQPQLYNGFRTRGRYEPSLWNTLHTGKYAGGLQALCDATAVALIISTLTGLYMYFKLLLKKKES